ncbi:MAG: PAS domain S-box protein [bacterium]
MKDERAASEKDLKPKYEELVKQNEEMEKRIRELTLVNEELTDQFFCIDIPVIVVNKDLCIRQFSLKAGEILHMDSTAIGRIITDYSNYLNVPNLEGLMLEVMKNGIIREQKVQDNEGHWYDIRFMPCRINNNIEGLIIVVIDIDSLMATEQILRYKLSSLIHILDYMEDGVYIANQNHEIVYINPMLQKEFGIPEGRKCFEYFHNRQTECPWCKNREVLSGKTVRWEWHSPRTEKVYELIDAPLKNPDESISKIVIFSDITDRKKVEQRLQENENKFRQFIESMHEGIWVIDKDDVTTFVNPRMANLLGYSIDEMLEKPLFSFIKECDRKLYQNYLFRCREGIRESHDFEFIRKDGTLIYVRIEFSQTTDINGNYIGAVAYVTDITDIKRLEEALRDSEAKFLALAENSSNMIFINRMERILYASRKSEESLGYKKEELYSPYFNIFTLIAPESKEKLQEDFALHLKGEKTAPLQFTLISKNGKRIDALLTTDVIYNAGEKATLGIITDIKNP